MKLFIVFFVLSFMVTSAAMVIRDVRNYGFRIRYYDCRMRLCTAAAPAILALIDILTGNAILCPAMVSADISLGPLSLLLCPARHEKAAMSYSCAFTLLWTQLSLSLLCRLLCWNLSADLASVKVLLSAVSGQALLLWYLARRVYIRYGKVNKLFSNLAVWHGACDLSRFVYSMGLFLAMGFVMQGGPVCAAVASLAACILYVLCYIRIIDDTGLLVGKDVEQCIKDAIKGHLYERVMSTPEDDRRMMRLFERVKAIMVNDKPYRNEAFSLPDFASLLLTNKVYLSRTINLMAGCNFRNFVNWYRIEDARRMIRENPDSRIADIMIECGFRTHQTFETAFLRQCGESPREYQERAKVEKLKPLMN